MATESWHQRLTRLVAAKDYGAALAILRAPAPDAPSDALTPDSPTLTALKLAAVNLGTAGEGWPAGAVRRSDIARKERAVLKAARAFAKEQREGSDG